MKHCHAPHPELDGFLDALFVRIAATLDGDAELRTNLSAVLLGGGYGRGEGGVFHDASGRESLYNDLDLFVFARDGVGRDRRDACAEKLRAIGEAYSREAGIEVEFGPITTPAERRRLRDTLMYQELARGFQPVWGECPPLPVDPFAAVPLSEGARLLLNRGAGLLLARRELAKAEPDTDFVARNANKAVLAAGDAYLLARGSYVFGCDARYELLCRDAEVPAGMREAYAAALEFKYAPGPVSAEEANRRRKAAEAVWLAAQRDFRRYCRPKGPHSLRELGRNVWYQLRYFGGRPFGELIHHPRERLFADIVSLLEHGADEPAEQAFLRRWQRFN